MFEGNKEGKVLIKKALLEIIRDFLHVVKINLIYKPLGFITGKIVRYINRNIVYILMRKIIGRCMNKMTYKTKIRYNKGSMTTVIPSALVKLLGLEHGEKIEWTAKIDDNGFIVTVEAEEKKD